MWSFPFDLLTGFHPVFDEANRRAAGLEHAAKEETVVSGIVGNENVDPIQTRQFGATDWIRGGQRVAIPRRASREQPPILASRRGESPTARSNGDDSALQNTSEADGHDATLPLPEKIFSIKNVQQACQQTRTSLARMVQLYVFHRFVDVTS
jgi:hypothetical protein